MLYFFGVPDYKVKRLQRMHNIAARIVARPPCDHAISDVLQSLHWLPVKFRILFKSLLLVYKCIHNLAPKYLTSLLTPYEQKRYGLRSNELELLSVPHVALKSYGHRAFSDGAVVECNKLPLKVRQAPSVDVFKSRLKTYLFEMCFLKIKKKFFFCLLLILRFGDEVNFSVGFPARPVGSLGQQIPSAWLLVLLGPPTRSSISPLSLGRTWATFRLAFRLSAG